MSTSDTGNPDQPGHDLTDEGLTELRELVRIWRDKAQTVIPGADHPGSVYNQAADRLESVLQREVDPRER